jgi:nucleoid-associated protein YgaU
MTRQAVPSIVLSVLIVCFFAIALFQPDPPNKSHGQGRRRARGGIARTASRPTDRSSVARTDKPLSRAPDPVVRATDKAAPTPKAGASRPPGTSFVAVANRPAHPPARSAAIATITRAAVRTDSDFGPHGSFTVVKAGETLADVALRVYGTTREAASLWRANRDALLRPDSPLEVGMLLRTPSLRKDEG